MLFKKRTMEETNQRLAEREQRQGFGTTIKKDYASYKEKQAERSAKAKEYHKGLSPQKNVEKDFNALGKGARAGLSGGTLFSRMTRRR